MEKKVVVDADAVLTLSKVAKELHYGLRWKSHRTDARKDRIDFTDGEGRRFRLDLGGIAYAFIGKKESAEPIRRSRFAFVRSCRPRTSSGRGTNTVALWRFANRQGGKMKTVVFDDELVLSIADVAKRLEAALGWMNCEPDGEECSIRFTVSDGRRFEMDKHGLAYEIDERGETKVNPDERESILIPDVLNYPETMWAHDTDGKWVLVVMPYD